MKATALAISVVILMTASHAAAQGPHGPQGRAGSGVPSPVLEMTKLTTISGKVASIDIGYGAQYPSFAIGSVTIKAAPVWYFLNNDFELKAGDSVNVLAAPSTIAGDPYLYAVQITNTATAARIALRDSAGVPLWAGQAGNRGKATQTGTGCVDAASIATVTGTVEKVTAGYGIQMPTLVVKSADETLVTMKIGPERILLEADFELKAGDRVTARYAHASCTDEYVALQLMSATGAVLTLRNDDGTPAWN